MRLAFATDLHLFATERDFHQQAFWEAGVPRLPGLLADWVRREGVEVLLLGGDLVADGTPTQIAAAVDLLAGVAPQVALCLGNHDVTQPQSADHWQAARRRWPGLHLADSVVAYRGVTVVTVNVHWTDADGRVALRWVAGTSPVAVVTPAQQQWLDRTLAAHADQPAIVLLHAELDPLLPALTGLAEPIHAPPPAYAADVAELLDRHPQVRLVLGGHNHVTHAAWHGRRAHLTTGAISEWPYSVRLIDVEPSGLTVTTVALPVPAEAPGPRPDRLWVAGRETDRSLRLPTP